MNKKKKFILLKPLTDIQNWLRRLNIFLKVVYSTQLFTQLSCLLNPEHVFCLQNKGLYIWTRVHLQSWLRSLVHTRRNATWISFKQLEELKCLQRKNFKSWVQDLDLNEFCIANSCATTLQQQTLDPRQNEKLNQSLTPNHFQTVKSLVAWNWQLT